MKDILNKVYRDVSRSLGIIKQEMCEEDKNLIILIIAPTLWMAKERLSYLEREIKRKFKVEIYE